MANGFERRYKPAMRNLDQNYDDQFEFDIPEMTYGTYDPGRIRRVAQQQAERLPELQAGLEEARTGQRVKTGLADLGQIGSEYLGAITGRTPSSKFYESLRKRAGDPVKEAYKDISNVKDVLKRAEAADKRFADIAFKRSEAARRAAKTRADIDLTKAEQRKIDAEAMSEARKDTEPLPKPQKRAKQAEYVSGGYASRMEKAEADMEKLLQRYDPGGILGGVGASILDKMGVIGEVLKPEDRKLFEQIQADWVTANLRKESGAAIPPEELEQEKRKYFARPGEGTVGQEAKRRSREIALAAMKAAAGPAYQEVQQELSRSRMEEPIVKAEPEKPKGFTYTDPDDGSTYEYVGPMPATAADRKNQNNWNKVGG